MRGLDPICYGSFLFLLNTTKYYQYLGAWNRYSEPGLCHLICIRCGWCSLSQVFTGCFCTAQSSTSVSWPGLNPIWSNCKTWIRCNWLDQECHNAQRRRNNSYTFIHICDTPNAKLTYYTWKRNVPATYHVLSMACRSKTVGSAMSCLVLGCTFCLGLAPSVMVGLQGVNALSAVDSSLFIPVWLPLQHCKGQTNFKGSPGSHCPNVPLFRETTASRACFAMCDPFF